VKSARRPHEETANAAAGERHGLLRHACLSVVQVACSFGGNRKL
jgi:hypothetical protein